MEVITLLRLSSDCFRTGREHKLNLLHGPCDPKQRMDVWFCAGRDHAERHAMRAEVVDTGARSQERAGEKCVFYLTETYMDVGQQEVPSTCRAVGDL
jgi:hypothetical protein